MAQWPGNTGSQERDSGLITLQRAKTSWQLSITACAETEANARSAAVVTIAVAIARLGVAVTGFDIGAASIIIGVAVVASFNVSWSASPIAATVLVTHQPDIFCQSGLYEGIPLIE
jgi:hypothetical protein